MFPNPGPQIPPTVHIHCSPEQTHLTQLNEGLLISLQVESGVLAQVYNKNVYCWGYLRTRVGKQWERVVYHILGHLEIATECFFNTVETVFQNIIICSYLK